MNCDTNHYQPVHLNLDWYILWVSGIGNNSFNMMTSTNGNIFRITGPSCGEFTSEFPSQRPVTQSFDVFFDIHAWTNGWVNNWDADDWRRHRAHYDVTVMSDGLSAEFCQAITWNDSSLFAIAWKYTSVKVRSKYGSFYIKKCPVQWCWPFCLSPNVLL